MRDDPEHLHFNFVPVGVEAAIRCSEPRQHSACQIKSRFSPICIPEQALGRAGIKTGDKIRDLRAGTQRYRRRDAGVPISVRFKARKRKLVHRLLT